MGVLIIERGRSVKGLKPFYFYVKLLSVETRWLSEEYLVITIDERIKSYFWVMQNYIYIKLT